MENRNLLLRKIVIAGMLAAIAYIVMSICRIHFIPSANFLTYDPKDVIITIAGFILDPIFSVIISIIVSLLEAITVSGTGYFGFIMNVSATIAFTLPVTIIYKKKRTLQSTVFGFFIGIISMTAVMILLNYILTPIYMGQPREAVIKIIIPALLPFNLIKASLNSALAMLLYIPLSNALAKARLLNLKNHEPEQKSKYIMALIIGAAALLVVCIIFMIMFML